MYKKILVVGDMHVRVQDLSECERLIGLIDTAAKQHRVDKIVFLGDQFHNHSLLHVEVIAFWKRALWDLRDFYKVLLVGNHDRSNDRNVEANAMLALTGDASSPRTTFVFGVHEDADGIGYISYQFTEEAFASAVQRLAGKGKIPFLFCHQSFKGGQYDNGMYIPDGIDASFLPCAHIISGHIHMPQQVGKVWYPGAPRWMSLADANQDRGIWVVELTDDELGAQMRIQGIDTSTVCTPIFHLQDCPEAPADVTKKGSVVVDIHGPEGYIKARREELAPLGWRIRSFPVAQKVSKVTESGGVKEAMRQYVDQYEPRFGASKEEILKICGERISW